MAVIEDDENDSGAAIDPFKQPDYDNKAYKI